MTRFRRWLMRDLGAIVFAVLTVLGFVWWLVEGPI